VNQSILDKPLNKLVAFDWEKAVFALIIILALATRLWGLGDRVQSHDESIHTRYSWNLYAGHGFQHAPLMHGPFLFHATALSYFLFSDNDFTARLPVALMGVALVAFPYLFRRWLGRAGALVTSFFLLISPSIAYYSRYIRHDIPIMLWALIVVLAIFSYLRDRRERWLYVMAAGVSLMFATKEVAFIYNAIFGLFLVGLFAVRALGREWPGGDLKTYFLAALVAVVLGLVVLGLGFLQKPEEQPALVWWAIAGGGLGGLALLVAATLLLVGTWRDLAEYPSFDLIVVLGTLCLPFLSPLLIQLAGFDPVDYAAPTIYYSGAIAIAVFAASACIGLAWNWKRWSTAAAVHYAIFVILFTTIFTKGTGIASGIVGSLGYWLAQQEVQRGGQPWYYYLIVLPLYDYLPLALSLIAAITLAVKSQIPRAKSQIPNPKAQSPTSNLQPPISDLQPPTSNLQPLTSNLQPPISNNFLPFLLWWIVSAWVSYAYAGEKMPWLVVHLALPMILLAGWLIGQLIERTDWQRVRKRQGWLLALVAPPFAIALAMCIGAAVTRPFQGYELGQLEVTGRFLSALFGTLAFGAGLGYLIWRTGWRAAVRVLLLVALVVPTGLTIRHAWRFCYVNYDYPSEHLVYAHAAPGVNEAMRQIEQLSRRTVGDPQAIELSYGADGSTLWYWQLRDFPNAVFYGEEPTREQMEAPVVIAGRDQWEVVAPYLDRDYTVNTYTYLWWPMEDYRNMTWPRVTHAITDTQTRAALWDIWYDRDYRRYDELKGKKHTFDEWPLRSDFRLYVRRDVMAEVWDLGLSKPMEAVSTDPYAGGWRDLAARQVIGGEGSAPGQFLNPRGVTVGPDGFVYVADAGNHRVQKFTADGEFVAAWGRQSTLDSESGRAQGFNDPWDVAVGPDGTVYVADTWNHRIQQLDAAGETFRAWGWFGQYGPGDAAGQSAFYGPRGVAFSPEDTGGRVYVSDTGNKRVQVFDPDGGFISQWGGGGVLEGYLDEPVGIALGPDDTVYVADTWNRRVQVFDKNGAFLRQWSISGWDTGLAEEKPYLAVDAHGYVYVTDPGHYRVLVFDSAGNYVLSFGQYGLDARSFALPVGIALAEDGTIYVSDSHGNRVLVFASLNLAPHEWEAYE